MENRKLVYVDIGGSHITLVAGEIREDNSLFIQGKQEDKSDEVKSGLIKRTNGVAHKISTLTRFLENAYNLDPVTRVSTSVNARSMKIFPYSVKLDIPSREITEEDLIETENRCRKYFSDDKIFIFECLISQYIVDDVVVENPVGLKAKQLEVDYNVVVGHSLINDNYTKCFERTGLTVDYVHLGLEAVATAVLEDDDVEKGCALIMFGANSTTLGIYDNGVLKEMLVVPYGGDDITKDICYEVSISYENAEKVKKKLGRAIRNVEETPMIITIPHVDKENEEVELTTTFLSKIVEEGVENILKPIIDKINATDSLSLGKGIVITGGAGKLKGLQDYLEEQTGLEVTFGDHSDILSEDTDPVFYDTRYSEAVGAMLLTNDLLEDYEDNVDEKNISVAIESKVEKKSMFGRAFKKMSNKITDRIPELFD